MSFLVFPVAACPTLSNVPHVLILHGEGHYTNGHMQRRKPDNWILHKPPLPISFGTHQSKLMLLVYQRGLRIVVHSANLIEVDWNKKAQGLWMQDFPWKDDNCPSKPCSFENDLVDYLYELKWPEFEVELPSHGNFTIKPSFFQKFDYSNATVRLIASVPGIHKDSDLYRWGHMKLRRLLRNCNFENTFQDSPLAYQCSSIGLLDEKWMTELATSLSFGFLEDNTPLAHVEPRIIWPSVEDIRCSIEIGYAAGNAAKSPLQSVEKEFLKKYWSKWKAVHTGHCGVMPGITTVTRYKDQKLAWLLMTSANLGKAAWGILQNGDTELMIRSYELGVLFLSSSCKRHAYRFSCTEDEVQSENICGDSKLLKRQLVTSAWQGRKDLSSEVIPLPVPYELPPQPYSSEDVPWSWDRQYTKKDAYDQLWPPKLVKSYTS